MGLFTCISLCTCSYVFMVLTCMAVGQQFWGKIASSNSNCKCTWQMSKVVVQFFQVLIGPASLTYNPYIIHHISNNHIYHVYIYIYLSIHPCQAHFSNSFNVDSSLCQSCYPNQFVSESCTEKVRCNCRASHSTLQITPQDWCRNDTACKGVNMKITSIHDDTGARCKKKMVRSFQIKRCFWASAFTASFWSQEKKRHNTKTSPAQNRGTGTATGHIWTLDPGNSKGPIVAGEKAQSNRNLTKDHKRNNISESWRSYKTTLRHAETVQSPLSLCISSLLQELSEQSHSRDHVRQILVSVPRPLLPRFSTPGHPNRILLSSEPSIQRSRKHGHEGSVARWSFGKSPEKMPRLRADILPLVRIARFLFWFQKIGGFNCRHCCTQ